MDTFKIHYKIPDILAVLAYRPDIIVYSRCLKKVTLIELTVPWETNISKDHTIKSNKYCDLTNEITRNGFKTQLYVVEVGARGIPAKSLHRLLKDLGLPRSAIRTFMERVSKMALTGSYSIWLSREGSKHSAGKNKLKMEGYDNAQTMVKQEIEINPSDNIEVTLDEYVNDDSNVIKQEDEENDDAVQVPAPIVIKTEIDETTTVPSQVTLEHLKEEVHEQVNIIQQTNVNQTNIQDEVMIKYEVYEEENEKHFQPEDDDTIDEDIQMKLEPIVNINDNVVPSCLIRVVSVNNSKDECATEEILSNIDSKCLLDEYKCDDSHLNSITGNMMSLEEEAYQMLNKKSYKQCPKCPKLCSNSLYKYHLNVHKSIERRELGVLKRKNTLKARKQTILVKNDDKIIVKGQGSFFCSKCGKNYNLKRSLLRHQRVCKDRPGSIGVAYCILSGKTYKTERQLVKHKEICKECARNGLQGIWKAEENKMGGEKNLVNTDKPIFIAESNKINPVKNKVNVEKNKSNAEKNITDNNKNKMSKGEYLCPCGNGFHRRSRMETCLRSHNENPEIQGQICHSCIVCGKNFGSKLELMTHRKSHIKKKHQCKFCPTDYHTPKELIKHLKIHQKVQLMEYEVISAVVQGKQELNCFICGKTWKELTELKTHMLGEHKGPYICSICKQEFAKIIDLASHTKSSHPELEGQEVLSILEAFTKLAQSWKCEECELQFDQPDKLALHQAEQHLGKKLNSEPIVPEFQCLDCSRVFITGKQLSTHRRVVHEDVVEEEVPEVSTDPGFMCIHCRKVCSDENALASHMRLHSPERKYVCKFCDFRFATVEKRRSHALIHTGDMKYVCFICEYVCSSENRLNLHKQSVKHISMKEFLLTGVPLVSEAENKPTASDKKKKSSSTPNNIPSTCTICGETFPSETKMQVHKQTHPFIEFPNEDEPSRIFFK